MLLDFSDDKGQVGVEQLLIVTSIIGVAIIVGYVIKTQLGSMTGKEKTAANETFNKST